MYNGLHIADPSGFSFWKKFFTVVGIIAAAVAVVATAGTLAPAIVPGLASTAFFTSAIGETLLAAAPTIVGASFAVAGVSTAAAATLPGHSSSPGTSIPINTGTPFTPTPPNPEPLGDRVPELPPSLPGDQVPQPIPQLPGDRSPERPIGGWLIDQLPEYLGPVYNALDVSQTPRPTEDVGNTGSGPTQQTEEKPPQGNSGEIRWDPKRQRWVDDDWVYKWDERPHGKRGGGPHWDRGPKKGE